MHQAEKTLSKSMQLLKSLSFLKGNHKGNNTDLDVTSNSTSTVKACVRYFFKKFLFFTK